VSRLRRLSALNAAVLGIEGLIVPLPEQQTMFCITLDNSIDYIRTPYTVLTDGAKVNQEFSLYVELRIR
jgi:serine/arginine repetitive matrix protein 2